MSNLKQETVTFKVDAELARLLAAMPNRSEFIRQSLLQAIDHACPLCQGTGNLSLQQKRQWESLVEDYHLERCDDCHVIHEHSVPHRCEESLTKTR
jgi:hypothetical protein